MKDRAAAMGESTPICRCRVLYLGSAVPRQSKDGLQGIQEPLRSLYPSEGAIGAKGIDSWLSVWSNGILLENVDENRKQVTRFFPIDSLHYCAAVRQVLIPERGNSNPEPKFLPLDSPFARTPRAQHPPIFAAILRRTTGIKVLECHTFICKREAAANALVRCCFHAYADNSYARQLEGSGSGGGGGGSGSNSVYGTIGGKSNGGGGGPGEGAGGWRSRAGSTTTLNSVGMSRQAINGVTDAYTVKNLYASSADLEVVDDGESSLYNGDENHKVWNGSTDQIDGIGFGNDGHYDIYSGPGSTAGGVGGGGGGGGGSTLGRPARIRQISAPVPVPPPPKEEPKKSKKDKKLASKAAASQQQQQLHLQQQLQHQHQLQQQQQQQYQQQQVGGSQSLSGTLIRPRPMHMNPLGRPAGGPGNHHHHPHHHQSASSAAAMAAAAAAAHHGMMMYHPGGIGAGGGGGGGGMPPPPVPGRQFHTIGHRSMNGSAMAMMAAAAHAAGHHPSPSHLPPPPPTHLLHHPSHPAHLGHLPAMMAMAPQYATLQHPRTSKGKKNKDKHGKGPGLLAMNGGHGLNGGSNGGPIPIGVPIVPPMFAYPPQAMVNGGVLVDPSSRPLSMSNRKLAQSAAAGLDDVSNGGGGGGGTSGAESPGGTGIYRRKGHLNERAFSYSIRQEHRSRSHGSLASLQFNPPDLKKEREIAQMVAGLELTSGGGAGGVGVGVGDDDSTMTRRRSEMAGSSGTFGKPRR
ncbi:maternal protein pumilio [Anopheles darlingi]|uniref:maternal protein pumilio n=1 Tax=Anopheles darlingi TaxID=43151 RepID=UPI0021000A42|nr:maternal protein pumilio [Anopheles darlingi]XP_049534065.1 maternal protein pumilio [Anopheles darlingi]XP_049534066.1 maternal protein pumilio [Anopheles darlingi]XP_049534068.1 maternal protein pumilio [Anopheles darlingi]XP_049534069.1 maternal protein pumilio [Anopheles darlingi]